MPLTWASWHQLAHVLFRVEASVSRKASVIEQSTFDPWSCLRVTTAYKKARSNILESLSRICAETDPDTSFVVERTETSFRVAYCANVAAFIAAPLDHLFRLLVAKQSGVAKTRREFNGHKQLIGELLIMFPSGITVAA